MLKYTTYKSIYDVPESTGSDSLLNLFMQKWGKQTAKLVLFLLLLSVTGTGVVSAFASTEDSSNTREPAIVVVHRGDTLWEIAVAHKPVGEDTRVYVEAIKSFNGLPSSNIQAGSTLKMP